MLIEIDLNTVMAAVGVDILIGLSAMAMTLRNHRQNTNRFKRIEDHIHLPAFAEEK
jgi:hypothetical protein